eukprot:1764536-Amphidinium_carterae.1
MTKNSALHVRDLPNLMTQTEQCYSDVLANHVIYMFYRLTSQFRMVAEQVHRLRSDHQGPVQGLPHEVRQEAEQGLLPGYDFVYSALLVKPTRLDPTSVSTTTWSTSTRCISDINMLTTPKQHLLYSKGTNKIKQLH